MKKLNLRLNPRMIIIILLLKLCCFTISFFLAGRWLTIKDPVEKTDVIWVLGGGGSSRLERGIELYQKDVAEKVLFTGGGDSFDAVLKAAKQNGLPEDSIIALGNCLSTYDEALAVRRYVQENEIQSIVFVTDIYHTRRARSTFKKYLPGVKIYSSPAKNSNYNEKYWWKTEEGVLAVFSETVKGGYYLVRYGII